MRQRRLVGADHVAHRGVLQEVQLGADTHGAQVIDDGFGLVALTVGHDVDVETVGVARFGQQLLGQRRVVLVGGRAFLRATHLRGRADGVDEPAAFTHDVLQHGIAVDRVDDGLAHALVFQLRRGRAFLDVHLHEHDAHGVAGDHLQVRHLA
ncbi:hypothetical protein D3C86_1321060 [compost metagenome]